MKNKIRYGLNFIWTCFIAFSFPLCFAWIFLDITGHSKGYGYNLGSEKGLSVMLGCVELIIWLVLALPSNIYVFKRTNEKGKFYLIMCIVLYIALAVLSVCFLGGWSVYLKDVFNVSLL